MHFQGTGERLNSGHPPRRPTDHHGSLQGADADSAVRVGGGVRRAVAAKAVVTATAGAGWRRSHGAAAAAALAGGLDVRGDPAGDGGFRTRAGGDVAGGFPRNHAHGGDHVSGIDGAAAFRPEIPYSVRCGVCRAVDPVYDSGVDRFRPRATDASASAGLCVRDASDWSRLEPQKASLAGMAGPAAGGGCGRSRCLANAPGKVRRGAGAGSERHPAGHSPSVCHRFPARKRGCGVHGWWTGGVVAAGDARTADGSDRSAHPAGTGAEPDEGDRGGRNDRPGAGGRDRVKQSRTAAGPARASGDGEVHGDFPGGDAV